MVTANTDCSLNHELSTIYTPEIDFKGIEWEKDVMRDINQERMLRVCRSCGSTLSIVRFCDGCSEPVKWDCDSCWSMSDVTHSHIGNFNFSGEEP
jgi:hypothetical protein